MAIESLGLGSGVLTSDLVDKLVQAERASTELRLDRTETLVDAKITAYGEIRSLMSKLNSSVSALSDPAQAGATKATSSDDTILTASSASNAATGTYNVNVLNTAKSHSLASKSFAGFNEEVGTGKLVISFGKIGYDGSGKFQTFEPNDKKASKTINIDSGSRSLNGIKEKINSENIGVKASIVNDGSGYRLLLTSEETGEENALRIEALDDSGNPLSTGLSAFAFNETQNGPDNFEQKSKGEDAQISLNGLNITRSSNTITEVIDGVTLDLNNADAGKTVAIKVDADVDKLAGNIESFVNDYNKLKKFVDDISKYDNDKQEAGLLLGDSTIRGALNEIRSMVSLPIEGITGSKYRSLTELGLNTDKNNDYLLKFSRSDFNTAVAEDRNAVVSILAKSGTTSDSQIVYSNDSINSKAGSYDIQVTQLATQAQLDGGSLTSLDFSSPVIIDTSNDEFTINVDGTNASVKLTQGSYATGEDLARELSIKINGNESLSKIGKSVSVDFDAAEKRFSITSNRYGSDSQVSFSSVDTNTANTLGFNTLTKGTFQGVSLTTLNSEAFNGKGAITQIGSRTVDTDVGIDFAANNGTFSLNIDGTGPVAVTVNQNASGVDLNGDGVFGDRKDTLQAIQTAVDATSLNGKVTASFDDQGYLQFETTQKGASKSIELTGVGSTTSDVLLGLDGSQGVQTNGKDPGVVLAGPIQFKFQVDGRTTDNKVTIPAGNYLTGDALATEIQNQINTTLSSDPQFVGVRKGAETNVGSRNISTNIDFSAANAGFVLNVNGVKRDVLVNSDSGNNITDIQSALDTAFGASVVAASLDGNGLKLTSVAEGYDKFIQVESDGRGVRTGNFANLNSGINFSGGGNNATFTLGVGGIDINVDVNEDGTQDGNNSASNLAVIQKALDSALTASGEFQAGDIKAQVDSSGNLYFETFAKNGVRTASTFGASATLEIKNLGGTASSALGLTAGVSDNGYEGFGIDNTRKFGYDVDTQVEYVFDADTKLGSFKVTSGGQGTQVGFQELDAEAISAFGFQDASVYNPQPAKGLDVQGTINGVEAKGNGQFLRANDGNLKAKNGFYVANTLDLSTPLVLDANNSKFMLSIDGVEAEVSLNFPATYVNGDTLAIAMQKAIDDNPIFKGKGVGAKVEYTDNPESFAYQKLSFISKSTGKDSVVEITDISAEATSAFGFVKGIGDGERGTEQDGDIDNASGLRVKVIGGGIGERGSVTYVQGFADRLEDILANFLNGERSLISVKENALKSEKTEIGEDRKRLDTRVEAFETRLKLQFQANDAVIQKLKTTQDFIKQQFEAMANASK
ncbi:flagellar capping protein [Thalassolituus sp. HI0120]|nr:flagellar capping protein [Thalassolituus sp. HI0120]